MDSQRITRLLYIWQGAETIPTQMLHLCYATDRDFHILLSRGKGFDDSRSELEARLLKLVCDKIRLSVESVLVVG